MRDAEPPPTDSITLSRYRRRISGSLSERPFERPHFRLERWRAAIKTKPANTQRDIKTTNRQTKRRRANKPALIHHDYPSIFVALFSPCRIFGDPLKSGALKSVDILAIRNANSVEALPERAREVFGHTAEMRSACLAGLSLSNKSILDLCCPRRLLFVFTRDRRSVQLNCVCRHAMPAPAHACTEAFASHVHQACERACDAQVRQENDSACLGSEQIQFSLVANGPISRADTLC